MYLSWDKMKYTEYNMKNPRCIHCFISDRAYASVITEVMSNGQNETGGVFLGYIINRAWYIMESVDPGIQTVNELDFFEWDSRYVNHQAERLSRIYRKPLTILGFWHRHPGSMDFFSARDESTIRSNLKELREGLLSMLVNIDPKLRMTYYYCYGNEIMPIRYDVGDRYFPVELLCYADAGELSRRAAANGRPLEIHYQRVLDLDALASHRQGAAGPSPVGREAAPSSPPPEARAASREELPRELIKTVVQITLALEGGRMKQLDSLVSRVSEVEKSLEALLARETAPQPPPEADGQPDAA